MIIEGDGRRIAKLRDMSIMERDGISVSMCKRECQGTTVPG